MKKGLMVALAALLCALLAGSALAEGVLYPVSPMMAELEYVSGEYYDDRSMEEYSYDGAIFIDQWRIQPGADGYPDIAGETLEQLMSKWYNDRMDGFDVVDIEPIAGYPTRRIHFETSANEDSRAVEGVCIWTEDAIFVLDINTPLDLYYGYMEGYEEGWAAAYINDFIATLELVAPQG